MKNKTKNKKKKDLPLQINTNKSLKILKSKKTISKINLNILMKQN